MGHWLNDPPFEEEPPGYLGRAIRWLLNLAGCYTPAQREAAFEDDPIWDVRKEEAASNPPSRDLPGQQHERHAEEPGGDNPSDVPNLHRTPRG